MSNRKPNEHRRQFLKVGAAAAVALTTRAKGEDPDPQEKVTPKAEELPRRKLGKTGEMIPVLSLGTGGGPSTRLYEYAFNKGVKYFDVADCYGRPKGLSEENAAKWFQTSGKRKEVFLVTKDHPRKPDDFLGMADNRLKALKTDIIDLFFIHGIGDDEYPDTCVDWPTDKAWRGVAEKLKKDKKIKYFGFSTHCQPIEKRIALLNNAAKGGFVDAIMVATDPHLMHTNKDFNKALDACHKAGVGLIAMKTTRGVAGRRRRGGGDGEGGFPETIPGFEKTGWDRFGTVINAILTDERFSAICSNMENLRIIDANTNSARNHKPLTADQQESLMLAYEQYAMGYCNGCNGSCQVAAGGGVEFGTIARYLAYAEQDGRITEARRLYRELPQAARDFSNVDLNAAGKACVSRLDLASICKRADELLA